MRFKHVLAAATVLTASFLAGCTVTHDRWTITDANGTVTVRETDSMTILITAGLELGYDEYGRPVWKFHVTSGPHTGQTYEFPTKQDALNQLPGILMNGVWANGDNVTDDDIDDALYFVDTYWQDPAVGSL